LLQLRNSAGKTPHPLGEKLLQYLLENTFPAVWNFS